VYTGRIININSHIDHQNVYQSDMNVYQKTSECVLKDISKCIKTDDSCVHKTNHVYTRRLMFTQEESSVSIFISIFRMCIRVVWMCIKRHQNVYQKTWEYVSRLMTHVYTRRFMCTQEESSISIVISIIRMCIRVIWMCIKRHQNVY